MLTSLFETLPIQTLLLWAGAERQIGPEVLPGANMGGFVGGFLRESSLCLVPGFAC